MPPDPDSRLRALAEVVLRVGLNLQPGQPLLITDPYDLLGVHLEAMALAEAVKHATNTSTRVLAAHPAKLRALAEADDLRGYTTQVAVHTTWLRRNLQQGGAFLFLTGTAPSLFAGLPADRLARFEAAKWRLLGPVIQQLIRGASQWSLLPCPTSDWAALAGTSVPALRETLFDALRLDAPDPVATWQAHLASLTARCDELNAASHRRIRYTGPGTDLALALPRSHAWRIAQLRTPRGLSFVVNLPTEEVFTAPHKNSAEGRLTVSRPVTHNGTVMDGIELEFRSGKVIQAKARVGEDHLRRLLATDSGACRLGEAAIVPGRASRPWAGRPHYHTILDENAAHHVALGDAYRFCSRAWLPLALNSSQLHLDLPLDASVELH